MVAVPDVGGMKFRKRLMVVLPAPFRAEQTKYLAGSNLQVETIQRSAGAVFLG
jgi:hypothetical protein